MIYTSTVEADDFGGLVMTLPEEIIQQFMLEPGDIVHFKDLENGSFELTFEKK
jgi:hypothetical protein